MAMIDAWLVENVRANLREEIKRFESYRDDEAELGPDPLLAKGRESAILALKYALSMLDSMETAEVPQPLTARQQLRRLRDTLTEVAAHGLEEVAWWLREQKKTTRYYASQDR